MDEWQIVSFVFAGVILFLCALVKVSINQLDSKVTDLKQRLYDVDKSDSRMEYYRSRQVDANSTLLNKILDLEERIKGLENQPTPEEKGKDSNSITDPNTRQLILLED